MSERVLIDGLTLAAAPLRVELLRLDPALPLPTYAHPGDAGADFGGNRLDHRFDGGEVAGLE